MHKFAFRQAEICTGFAVRWGDRRKEFIFESAVEASLDGLGGNPQ